MKRRVKEDIIRLRADGKSYKEIVEILGCSKGSISYHCSGDIKCNRKCYRSETWNQRVRETWKRTRDDFIASFCDKHRSSLSDPAFTGPLLLYYAEGDSGSSFGFSNSSQIPVKLVMLWARRFFNVEPAQETIRVYIHELRLSECDRIKESWAAFLGVTKETIRLSLKKNKTKRVYPTQQKEYIGCVKYRVNKFPYGGFPVKQLGAEYMELLIEQGLT